MKKLVITGGSKGIGKQICLLLKDKYKITDFSRSTGIDLTKDIPLFKADILILNAGVWDNDFILNYHVPKNMADTVDKNTLTIFILSNAAYKSFGNDDYTAAKSGLLHYIRRMQSEGYQFSAVCPGCTNTGFWDKALVDHRKNGSIQPKSVAKLVLEVINAYEEGALITEVIILPVKLPIKK